MEVIDHIVEFDKYCETCKYKKIKDEKGGEPCNDCLSYSVNTNSRKPVRYEEDKEKIKDEESKKEKIKDEESKKEKIKDEESKKD